MRVHHLNCGSFCPLLGKDAVCHCLLLETDTSGLVLVDTGVGHHVSQAPRERMSWLNRWTLRPRFELEESALAQIGALGYSPRDVRHVVVTHLDVDHAGGLADFPEATVHVHAPELAAGSDPRYDSKLWRHVQKWERYDAQGEQWFGLPCVRGLRGVPDVLIIPLAGHTLGHAGVAVATGERWLLHAGDAYLDPVELDASRSVPWGTRISARLTSALPRQRSDNLRRLVELRRQHGQSVTMFSAHSLAEFAACGA